MEISTLTSLVERARIRDEGAWSELVRGYTPLLNWVTRRHRLTGHDASDTIQLTWIRCFENLHRLREPHALPTWLVTTCRRECLRVLRAGQRCSPRDPMQAGTPIGAMADRDNDPYDLVARRHEMAGLHAAIAELPDRQRRVLFELIHSDEAGYRVASQRLGVPVGSLGPTRQRAIERLRKDERLSALIMG